MDSIRIIENAIVIALRDAAAKAIDQGHPPGCCCLAGHLREPFLFFRVAEANPQTAFTFDEFGAAMQLLEDRMKIDTCVKNGENYISLDLHTELRELLDQQPKARATERVTQ